jgi:hypothetical protein
MFQKRSKFLNVRTEIDGLKFDSKKEAARWLELELLQKAGKISNLKRQVPFELNVNGIKIGKLVLDFTYTENGKTVYEDVKSKPTMTPIFKWKAKHFKAQYKQEINLVM